ncbi:thioredoxin-disulfide reductase [Candidatus Roizmanbacteria bacterium]|nr:thioredoxin-disulfide reductase [Candidatus Roizmanbacteria bacterium]
MKQYDVIIIGSGPAGLTAAIYTTRANLKTLVIAGSKWGGQLMLTTLVENYPGFPDGIQGPDLMVAMRKQAERFEAEIVDEDFTHGDFSNAPFKVSTAQNSFEGKAVIIATGADTKWIGAPGEKEKIGHGVSSCAPCDAFFFKNKNVIVVGGGDSAMEEALVLTNFATSVTIVHRRDSLRASQIMQERARKNPKIKFIFNSEVTEILGDSSVSGVKLRNNKTNEISEMPIDGVFVAIGHIPNSQVFKGIDMDEKGFIKVNDHYKTNIDGVFVAGDVHDSHYKQAVTAAGFGCMAALEAEKWLRNSES